MFTLLMIREKFQGYIAPWYSWVAAVISDVVIFLIILFTLVERM